MSASTTILTQSTLTWLLLGICLGIYATQYWHYILESLELRAFMGDHMLREEMSTNVEVLSLCAPNYCAQRVACDTSQSDTMEATISGESEINSANKRLETQPEESCGSEESDKRKGICDPVGTERDPDSDVEASNVPFKSLDAETPNPSNLSFSKALVMIDMSPAVCESMEMKSCQLAPGAFRFSSKSVIYDVKPAKPYNHMAISSEFYIAMFPNKKKPCPCGKSQTWQLDPSLFNLLQQLIMSTRYPQECDWRSQVNSLSDSFLEFYKSPAAILLVTLRLAVLKRCLSFVQWYQDNVDEWPSSFRNDIMLSICCEANIELFRMIARDWRGSSNIKALVLERLAYHGESWLVDYMLVRYKIEEEFWCTANKMAKGVARALVAASVRGHEDVVKLLIEKGANILRSTRARSMLDELTRIPSLTFNKMPLSGATYVAQDLMERIYKISWQVV
jgi:hypothetical protein